MRDERLRFATEEDAAAIAALYAPFVEGTHVSFEERAPSDEDVRAILRRASGVWPWLVLERSGEVAGYVYASAHRERAAYRYSVDVSAYVHEKHRRTGVTRRAYGALFEILALQGYCNAFAGIALPNDASVALHLDLGFEEVARYRNVGFKAGAWRDTVWLERPLRALEVPPAEPQALRTLAPVEVAKALSRPAVPKRARPRAGSSRI